VRTATSLRRAADAAVPVTFCACHIVNDRADFTNGQAFNVESPEHIVSFRSDKLKEDAMSGTKNKVVAITGASSGIGEATALLLAERGATVVLGARGPDRLAALADRIVRTGGEAAYTPTDVKRREDLSARPPRGERKAAGAPTPLMGLVPGTRCGSTTPVLEKTGFTAYKCCPEIT
jgi:hypothetical protein